MSRSPCPVRVAGLAAVLSLTPLAATAEGGALGDPTRPTAMSDAVSAPAQGSGPRWRVQSTLVATGRRVAVINGKTLRLGDAVDGATLVDIRPDGVTLEVEHRRLELRLLPQSAQVRK